MVGNDDALGARVAEAPLDPPHELALGPAAEALLRERLEDLVRERPRAAHDLDLRVVLHRAQRLDEARRSDRLDAGVDERLVPRVRQVRLLEPDPPARQLLADRGEEVARDLDERDALDLAAAGRVAEVREQRRAPVRLDEHGRVRALEPGQVAHVRLAAEDVRRPGDEQRLLEERGEPLDPASLRPCTRNSSASR